MSNQKILLEDDYMKMSVPATGVLLIQAKRDYIPDEDFRKQFNAIYNQLGANQIEKVIFDKQQLKVFNQQSMTWYHTDWKVRLKKNLGITRHRKVLPNDDLFKNSVDVGRDRIKREHPEFQFDDFDIVYKETVEQAIAE